MAPEVREVNAEKTGALIAQTRHELNMTQKELASHLHVSDRAVSKWERGAGFPDVSLLEPLAAELGLSVSELLRGERGAAPEHGNEAIRDAVRLTRQQLWRTIRRNALSILLVILFLGFFSEVTRFWEQVLTREEPIHCMLTAGIYTAEGERNGEVQVEISGERQWKVGSEIWRYYGRFAVEDIRETTFEDVMFLVSQPEDEDGNKCTQEITRYRAGIIDTETLKQGCYFAPSMEHFAVMTENGQIIATHDDLAKLMSLYPTMYHLDNVGSSIFR